MRRRLSEWLTATCPDGLRWGRVTFEESASAFPIAGLVLAVVLAWAPAFLARNAPAAGPAGADQGVWVMPRGDAGATGYRPEKVADPLVLLWEYETAEAIETTPIVGSGSVYVTDVFGGVEALSLQSGQSRWRKEMDTGFVAPPALLIAATIEAEAVDFPILVAEAGSARSADPNQPAEKSSKSTSEINTDKSTGTGDTGDTSEGSPQGDPPPQSTSSPRRGEDAVQETARRLLASRLAPLLVLGDVEGNVYGLDPATGQTRWRTQVDGEIDAAASFFALVPPGPIDSWPESSLRTALRVLVTSQDGNLRCLSASDGKLLWTYETGDQIRCGASIGGGRTFLGGCDGGLHLVDLRTGKGVGEPFSLDGPTGSTPAVVDRDVFLPTMGGIVYRFSLSQAKDTDGNSTAGSPVWQYQDPDLTMEYRSDVAVGPDRIIAASKQKQVDALDRETGKLLWRKTLRRRSDASPLIAGDDVWIASTDGRLVRLSLQSGEERWSYEIRGSFLAAPALVGDRLIIADDEGVVRCFGPAEASADRESDASL